MTEQVDFEARYRRAYADLGRPLAREREREREDGCDDGLLDAAQRRLSISLPAAVRAYFRAAGHERRLNHAHNRLLAPDDWWLEQDKLVILEENQTVLHWGVALEPADPAVFQASNHEPRQWFAEHPRFSEFIVVMLYWQAVMGGLGGTRSAEVDSEFDARVTGFAHVGVCNGMHAYGRQGVALCHLPWDDGHRVFAAATEHAALDSLAQELSLAWDPDYE